jgi:hypothetical protein
MAVTTAPDLTEMKLIDLFLVHSQLKNIKHPLTFLCLDTIAATLPRSRS